MDKEVNLPSITKEGFEKLIDDTISDKLWKTILDEIEGRFDNFLEGLLEDIIQDHKEQVGLFAQDLGED